MGGYIWKFTEIQPLKRPRNKQAKPGPKHSLFVSGTTRKVTGELWCLIPPITTEVSPLPLTHRLAFLPKIWFQIWHLEQLITLCCSRTLKRESLFEAKQRFLSQNRILKIFGQTPFPWSSILLSFWSANPSCSLMRQQGMHC